VSTSATEANLNSEASDVSARAPVQRGATIDRGDLSGSLRRRPWCFGSPRSRTGLDHDLAEAQGIFGLAKGYSATVARSDLIPYPRKNERWRKDPEEWAPLSSQGVTWINLQAA